MHVFSPIVQTVLSQLSKKFHVWANSRPKRMNPLLDILDMKDAQQLHSFLEDASESQCMRHVTLTANPYCRMTVNAKYGYVRASVHLASWKSHILFEMIISNKTVYFNVTSDFSRIKSILRLAGGWIVMMCKSSLNEEEISTINLVICSKMPMLHIQSVQVAHCCEALLEFLRKLKPKITFRLLNCLPS